jgi:putative redox protein
MGVKMGIVYEGELVCRCEHGPSGVTVKTDPPADKGGKGQSFAPTDLVAAALGSCMASSMGIVARVHNFPIEGTTVTVVKELILEPVRRIGKLSVVFHVKNGGSLSEQQRKMLEQATYDAPVLKSLNPEIEVSEVFNWE